MQFFYCSINEIACHSQSITYKLNVNLCSSSAHRLPVIAFFFTFFNWTFWHSVRNKKMFVQFCTKMILSSCDWFQQVYLKNRKRYYHNEFEGEKSFSKINWWEMLFRFYIFFILIYLISCVDDQSPVIAVVLPMYLRSDMKAYQEIILLINKSISNAICARKCYRRSNL